MQNPFDDLRRYAEDLSAEVRYADARRAANRAVAGRARRPRRAVVVVATTALFGLSNVALAATANPSIPGDLLYGVDRAYENVAGVIGLGGLHAAERLEEADTLIRRGNLGAALELVQEVLTKALESDDPEAAIAELEQAVGGPPAGLAALVDLARRVGSSDATGQDVAEAARALVERIGSPSEDAPGQTGDSPSDTAPGRTGDRPSDTVPRRGGGQP